MPPGVPQEVYDLVEDIMNRMPNFERYSQDVTFKVFERIDMRPQLLQRYRNILEGRDIDTVHRAIGKSVKEIDDRENENENTPPPRKLQNIELTAYTRFKPHDKE